MQRIEIRNNHSHRAVKPRVFDALIYDNAILLEVKNGKTYEKIDLKDVISQINLAKKVNNIGTTEP